MRENRKGFRSRHGARPVRKDHRGRYRVLHLLRLNQIGRELHRVRPRSVDHYRSNARHRRHYLSNLQMEQRS